MLSQEEKEKVFYVGIYGYFVQLAGETNIELKMKPLG